MFLCFCWSGNSPLTLVFQGSVANLWYACTRSPQIHTHAHIFARGKYTAQYINGHTAHVCQASVPDVVTSLLHNTLVYKVDCMVAGYSREGRCAAAALFQAATSPAQRGQ